MRSLAVVLVLAACHKSPSGASEDELKQQVAALRAKIATYATALPDALVAVPAKVEPPIMFRNGDGGHTEGDNAEVFDFEGLAKGHDSTWEHSTLMTAFDSPALVSHAQLEQAAATRWAIVIKRTARVTPVLSADGYTPGKIAVRVWVVDLASDKPVAVFDAEATTPEKIEVETLVGAKDGDATKAEAMMTAARLKLYDEMRSSLRGKIQAALKPLGKANVYENPDAVD